MFLNIDLFALTHQLSKTHFKLTIFKIQITVDFNFELYIEAEDH